jgi:hypothetical protein
LICSSSRSRACCQSSDEAPAQRKSGIDRVTRTFAQREHLRIFDSRRRQRGTTGQRQSAGTQQHAHHGM